MRKQILAGAARNRMCALLLAFAMLFLLPVTASADATSVDEYETYTLGDLYMQIDIPTDYAVYSEEKSSPDSMFEAMESSYERMKSYCEENSFSLDAWSLDTSYDINIGTFDDDINGNLYNYHLYGNEQIEELKESAVKSFEESGFMEVSDATVEEKVQATYIKIQFTNWSGGSTTYECMYMTEYNGIPVVIKLRSLNGPISDELVEEFEHVIDSIYFTETFDPPEGTYAAEVAAARDSSAAESSDYETYTLNKISMQIDIPADYVVYSEEKSSPANEFEKFQMDFEEIRDNCREAGVLMEAIAPELPDNVTAMPRCCSEITIRMKENSISEKYFDCNYFNDAEIKDLKDMIIETLGNDNIDFTKATIKQGQQAKYIVVTWSYTNVRTIYSILYATLYNGQMIYILLYSYDEPVSDELAKEFEHVVDSIYFTETLDPPEGTYAAEAALGDDDTTASKSELKFTIEEILKKDKEEKFERTMKTVCDIALGVVIIWVIGRLKSKRKKAKAAQDGMEKPEDNTEMQGAGNGSAEVKEPETGGSGTEIEETKTVNRTEENGAQEGPDGAESSAPVAGYCRKCGAKLIPGNAYCGACGAKIERPEDAER